jgi:nucleotide-binding universal stress UspA family protein
MAAAGGRLVVGVDGSPDAERALAWALGVAGPLGASVHVLHGSPLLLGDTSPAATQRAMSRYAAEVLDRARKAAHDLGTEVTTEAVDLGGAEALVQASRDAAAVVVGARGHGRVSGALIGSVSQHVARHAESPVVVVREPADPAARTVVVGVDEGPASRGATAFAFRFAEALAAPLLALHAWEDPDLDRSGVVLPLRPELDAEMQRAELSALDEELAPQRERHPGVVVSRDVVPTHPQRLLVDASHHAGLVVVGSRGRGGFTGLLLGSVSQAVLHSAACPVAVVR